jgi:hypothetical protein
MSLTWSQFTIESPDLAKAGRELFCCFGVGLAFLSTVRRDGGPRLHPICIVIAGDGLYGLIIPSPKFEDLRRDGRYALHSYPLPENEDAVYITGRAELKPEPALRSAVIEAFIAQPDREGPVLTESHFDDQTLVEFLIDTCLITRTTGHGDTHPQHTVWKAS